MSDEPRALPPSWRREAAWLFSAALALRVAVALFAAPRFPPADDGTFYHTVATRIASGAGYTWAWPDGAVTYAAHYPVGYPALLGAAYVVLGSTPLVAMLVNALFGALLVLAAYVLAALIAPGRARLAALMLALHPTLVLYTAALMTEALAASLAVTLAAYALWTSERRAGWLWRVPLGVVGAGLVLVRPQLLPWLPLLGAAAMPAGSRFVARAGGAVMVMVVGLALCLPWTLRNCQKMDGCVFVSANGGWNLLIGTLPQGRGSFAPIDATTVPPECRLEFGEASKDRCFGRAAARRIREQPGSWLRLAPLKLGQLFNHGAVASAYLSTSNGSLVSEATRHRIATVETLASRGLLLLSCWGLLHASRGRARRGIVGVAAALGALLALSPWGYLSELSVLAGLVALGPSPGRRPLVFLAATLLGLCVITHVVFFGAPRYALVWLPWLPLLWAWGTGGRPSAALPPTETAAPPARVF